MNEIKVFVSEEEYKNFQKQATQAIEDAIKNEDTKCLFRLSWINEQVAKIGKDPLLSYLVLSPDSGHPLGKRLQQIFKEIELNTFLWNGYHLAFRGCDEGTHVILRKDDPSKDKAPKIK